MKILTVFVVLLAKLVILHARPATHMGFPDFPAFGFAPQSFGQSSAQANANAFSNNFGPNGFGSSASNAGAQSFNSGGPLGNFGASASNSQSQGFNFNNGMLNGNANFAGSQTYNFGDRKINIAYSNGWGIGPDGKPNVANSNSITYTK